MTPLRRPVRRATDKYNIILLPASNPLILVKERRSRRWFEISIEGVFQYACRLAVARELAQRKADREAKKKKGRRALTDQAK